MPVLGLKSIQAEHRNTTTQCGDNKAFMAAAEMAYILIYIYLCYAYLHRSNFNELIRTFVVMSLYSRHK